MSGYMAPAKRQDWATPPALFDALDAEFGPFTCDPAATLHGVGHVAQTILGRPHAVIYWSEGLNAPWSAMDGTPSRVFLNPPYGREMPRWIEKAVAEVEAGHCERVVALIPARTDTKCWQRYILKEAAYDRIAAPESLLLVRFLPGRVKFVGASASAPFPSAVVVWER